MTIQEKDIDSFPIVRLYSDKNGDVLLLEDTTGKGHKTKNIHQTIRKSVFIVLEK